MASINGKGGGGVAELLPGGMAWGYGLGLEGAQGQLTEMNRKEATYHFRI